METELSQVITWKCSLAKTKNRNEFKMLAFEIRDSGGLMNKMTVQEVSCVRHFEEHEKKNDIVFE